MTIPLQHSQLSETNQLHISFSQVNTYLMCPMLFAHRKVWATMPSHKSVQIVLGRAIHKAVEQYYMALKETGTVVDVREMEQTYEKHFMDEINHSDVEVSYKQDQTAEYLLDTGKQLLQLFHAEIKPKQIAGVELPFCVSIPDISGNGDLPIKLVGFFDLIESDGDSYEIAELKTSAQKFSSIRLDYDLQPTVYSYALSGLDISTATCSVRYDVLVKTKTPSFQQYQVTRTVEDHERLIHLFNHVLRAIENRLFYRNQGWQCQDCSYRYTCIE